MRYGYSRKVNMDFEEAVEKARSELTKEGFGVLTEIDVKATLKKKLNKNFDNYIILGACNPQKAYRALQAEREIGLMLPCNVIVHEKGGEVTVSAVRPSVAMSMIENPELKTIAGEVEAMLEKVIDKV